jgi:hypothetical protein
VTARVSQPPQADSSLPSSWAIAAGVLGIGLVSFAIRIWLPLGSSFRPLNLQFPFFAQYAAWYVVGLAAYRRNWLLRLPSAQGVLWLGVAVCSFLGFALVESLGGASLGYEPFLGGLHWQSLAFAVREQFVGAGLAIALLVPFRHWLNVQGRLSRALSASAYAAYVIHAPIIIALAVSAVSLRLDPVLKFGAMTLVAVPICFLVSHFVFRRIPYVRDIL